VLEQILLVAWQDARGDDRDCVVETVADDRAHLVRRIQTGLCPDRKEKDDDTCQGGDARMPVMGPPSSQTALRKRQSRASQDLAEPPTERGKAVLDNALTLFRSSSGM